MRKIIFNFDYYGSINYLWNLNVFAVISNSIIITNQESSQKFKKSVHSVVILDSVKNLNKIHEESANER